MYKLVSNKIRCKFCGEVIESRGVHDFIRCRCRKCAVDGGTAYARRVFDGENPEDAYEDLSIYFDPETGKVLTASEADQANVPSEKIRIEIKEVPDGDEVARDILTEIPEPTKELAEAVISAPDISEEPEAPVAEEEKIVKRDEKGRPIAGRYPYGKK